MHFSVFLLALLVLTTSSAVPAAGAAASRPRSAWSTACSVDKPNLSSCVRHNGVKRCAGKQRMAPDHRLPTRDG